MVASLFFWIFQGFRGSSQIPVSNITSSKSLKTAPKSNNS